MPLRAALVASLMSGVPSQGDYLECNTLTNETIVGAVNRSHAAFAEELLQAVPLANRSCKTSIQRDS